MVSRKRIRHGSPAVSAAIYTFAILLGFVTLYPLIFIISNSISKPIEAAAGNVWLLPKGFSLRAYEYVFQSATLGRAFLNSIMYTAFIVTANVTVTMMAGYGLSRQGLIGKKIIQLYIILPMWFSAGLIPSFINMTRLGLVNSLWAIFLPSFLSIFYIILARTFIVKLPPALMEAATIDGAGVPARFFRIVLPLSKPIIAVLCLYVALAAWSEWFSYMIYLPTSNDLHPLQYFLVRTLLIGRAQSELSVTEIMNMSLQEAKQRLELAYVVPQLKYATIVVTIVPIMCLYPFVQKYFVQGVMLGSLKE